MKNARVRFRELCSSFPGVVETEATFRVGREAFAQLEEDAGKLRVSLRVEPDKDGSVTVPLDKRTDWEELRGLVLLAYVAVAPKKRLQELDDTISV